MACEVDIVRAGVFIGVERTGQLQPLQAAVKGAADMHRWATENQGFARAELVTDANGGRVTPDAVYEAIKRVIGVGGVDQLIVYFAGHGVNIHQGEHWLLTDAPERANAAVSVAGTVELARYFGGVGYAVFISDACRTAPEGIDAQNVRGQDLFPNIIAGGPAKPVDQFYACCLGGTAAEIKNASEAAGGYSALYTDALLDALGGRAPELLEPGPVFGDDPVSYVRPARLAEFLPKEVLRRVRERGLLRQINQVPDAIVLAHSHWIARLAGPRPLQGGEPAPTAPSSAPLPRLTRDLLGSVLRDDRAGFDLRMHIATRSFTKETRQMARRVTGFERGATEAGEVLAVGSAAHRLGDAEFIPWATVFVRGARLAEVFGVRGKVRLFDSLSDGSMAELHNDSPASVLLTFEDGSGAVVPALPGLAVVLTFEDGRLREVAYEPTPPSPALERFREAAPVIRRLRAIAAAASQHGRFRLDEAEADAAATRMRALGWLDPTLSIYLAYAWHDLQQLDRVREMLQSQKETFGVGFFDLALLGRTLVGQQVALGDGIGPFLPLFSQGWALLNANRVRLPQALDGIERMLRDSAWSHFTPEGCDRLKTVLIPGRNL